MSEPTAMRSGEPPQWTGLPTLGARLILGVTFIGMGISGSRADTSPRIAPTNPALSIYAAVATDVVMDITGYFKPAGS